MDLPSGSPNYLCGDAEKLVCVHSTFDGEEKHGLSCGWKELKVRMQKTRCPWASLRKRSVSVRPDPATIRSESLKSSLNLILLESSLPHLLCTWGILVDLIGRRLSFNITLFLAGVFGVAAGGSNNFTTLGALIACMGFGVGGKCYIPRIHPAISPAWWSLGQLFASLIAWPLIGNLSCTSASDCQKSSNMGWRYTLGGVTLLMWMLHYFVFDLQESPKYLVGKGRDEEAIKVLEHIARVNGKTITLTVEKLRAVSGEDEHTPSAPLTTQQIIKESFSSFSLSHVKPLFSTRQLATNTNIIIMLWGLIGLAYPLFNGFITLYLTTQVADSDTSISTTYRNYTIISVLGVPGSIIACLVVDLFTTSKTEAAVLGFSCASGLTQNAMYGVLYAYTPEVFPAPHRGTGDALCSSFNRITGILAPVIKIATTTPTGAAKNGTANGPIFVSASLFIVSALLMLFLPIETAGKAAL
ncbi:MFS general substrate transporter [Gymnopus androsaceus JB14]|uniref:MFS general substrate transporter n=1 Tax=Gymnopus androsaceus JB14 TaxID=1447944 RepID=A0A6A4H5C9_9AGAR|nr:MFS general substrate transporter [Gymnopus androsaceus JB14]